MVISLSILVLATLLAFGEPISTFSTWSNAETLILVIRTMLVKANKELDREELDLKGSSSQKLRIEEAARLEGITFEEAMERKKGFRYLV